MCARITLYWLVPLIIVAWNINWCSESVCVCVQKKIEINCVHSTNTLILTKNHKYCLHYTYTKQRERERNGEKSKPLIFTNCELLQQKKMQEKYHHHHGEFAHSIQDNKRSVEITITTTHQQCTKQKC